MCLLNRDGGMARSAPLEFPHVVLVAATPSKLLGRAETGPAVEQLITPCHDQCALSHAEAVFGDERLRIPVAARRPMLARRRRTPVGKPLECEFLRVVGAREACGTGKSRVVVFQPKCGGDDGACGGTKGARGAIQGVVARVVGSHAFSIRSQSDGGRPTGHPHNKEGALTVSPRISRRRATGIANGL